MMHNAMQAREILEQKGISLEVVSLKSLRPLDEQTIREVAAGKDVIFTLENHTMKGGVGDQIYRLLGQELMNKHYGAIAYPDVAVQHGSIGELEKEHGLDGLSIAMAIKKATAQVAKGITEHPSAFTA